MLPASPSRPDAKFTRCGMNDPHWHTLVDVTEYGKPDDSRMTPKTCHPPSTYAAAPPSESHGLPDPNGNSYPPLIAARCR